MATNHMSGIYELTEQQQEIQDLARQIAAIRIKEAASATKPEAVAA